MAYNSPKRDLNLGRHKMSVFEACHSATTVGCFKIVSANFLNETFIHTKFECVNLAQFSQNLNSKHSNLY